MKGIYTILLLIVSNSFMTFAWYGHLKMKQEFSWFAALPLIGVIAFSWLIAFFEYIFMVPANRIGFHENGGPFPDAAKSNPGSDHPCHIHAVHRRVFQRRSTTLESFRSILLPDFSCIFRIHEVGILC